MQNNKVLTARSEVKNYKGENDFENITIYLPLKYNDSDMSEYVVLLNIINEDNEGIPITLKNPTIYNDKYKYELPIDGSLISKPGKLTFWLKLLKGDSVVGLTNETSIQTYDSREITDYMPESQKTAIDEVLIKMQNIPDFTSKDDYWLIIGKDS